MKKLNMIAVAMEELAIEQEAAEASNLQEEELNYNLENIEHLNNETSTAMEAIAQLDVLASKLKVKEESGISLETYSDFALMVSNDIRKKLGMEAEEETPTSNKVKDFIKKIIEAIKLIISKITEFIKKIFSFTKFKNTAATKQSQLLLTFIKNKEPKEKQKIEPMPTIPLPMSKEEEIKFYPDLKEIKYNDVFISDFGEVFEGLYLIEWAEELYSTLGKELMSDPFSKEVTLGKIKNVNNKWFSKIRAPEIKAGEVVSKRISPRGSITLRPDSVHYTHFFDTPGLKIVDKQTIAPFPKENASAVKDVEDFFNGSKNRDEAIDSINKKFEDLTNNYLKLIDANSHLAQDELEMLRLVVRYMNGLIKAHGAGMIDLLACMEWYCSKIINTYK